MPLKPLRDERRARRAQARDFTTSIKATCGVIGRASAVANIFGVHLSGLIAWLVWLFVHLLYIVEFESRLLVAVEWGFLYLTFNRGARLITGNAANKPVGKPEPLERYWWTSIGRRR